MPSAFGLPTRSERTGRSASAFGLPSASSGTATPEAEAAALEQQLAAEGSSLPGGSGIVRSKTGIVSGLVDLLSRPNYAIAGAAEELFSPQGGGLSSVLGRVGSEVFSGLPGVQGQKEGFGQVLEQGGAPSLGSFSDIAPFLYSETGTGWRLQRGGGLDPTGRGVVGLGLDIVSDPLTYITAGGVGAVKRVLPRAGLRFLSPLGLETARTVEAGFRPAMEAAMSLTDDTMRLAEVRNVRAAMDDAVEAALVHPSGKPVAKEFFDPGGIKWFGKSVVRGETLAKIAEPARSALLAVPGGDKALEGAAAFRDGAAAALNGVFRWSGDVANLPRNMRDSAERLLRSHTQANAAIGGRLFAQRHSMAVEWEKLIKTEPNLGKMFTQIREGTGTHALTQRQQSLYDNIFGLYDKMEANGLALGILEPEQVAKYHGKYLHHRWLNLEDLSEVATRYGQPGALPKTAEKFMKERVFDTVEDGVRISRDMHEVGMMRRRAGEVASVYPVLEPDYDVMKNLGAYISQHSSAISRKWMYEDATRLFGQVPASEITADALWDVSRKIPVPAAEAERIGRFFDEPSFQKLAEGIGEKDWVAAWADLSKTARRQLGTLSDDGKREFFREMFTRIKSPSQFASIVNDFDQYRHLMPAPKAVTQGMIEPALAHFGETARYVQPSSSLWGETSPLLPELLVNEVEGKSAQTWKWMQANGIKQFIHGWDWLNNWFKTGVYTFWPGSLTRDVYNNVMQSFLDVGLGTFARPMKTAKIIARSNPSEVLKIGEHAFTQSQWYKMAVDLGVVDESGRMFVQMTGGKQQFSPTGTMAKVLSVRSKPENWTRIQHWVNNIDRGLDPRDAADKVSEFLFNYGELSRAERDLFRRAVPFYTFPRKAIELHVNALRSNPGRVINEIKPFRGRASEDSQMASWEAQSFKLRMDRDGKTVRVLTGIDLPIKTLDMLWRGNPSDTMRMAAGSLSPLLKFPIEQMTGKDLFTDREIKRRQAPAIGRFLEGTNSPEWLKRYVGFHKDTDAAGRPVYTVDNGSAVMVLFRSWAFSRLLTATDRQFREYYTGDPAVAASMLDLMTNLRYKDMDLDAEKQRKMQERLRLLREAAVGLGIRKEFSSVYTPKGGGPQ